MNCFDEMFTKDGVRKHYSKVSLYLKKSQPSDLLQKNHLSKRMLTEKRFNIKAFNGCELESRIYPFDIIPRIVTFSEWEIVTKGITQRLSALNNFLIDIYGKQEIIKDNIIPLELINSSPYFIKEMVGISLPHNVYIHISGFDLVKGDNGEFFILEDNLRIPSGIYSAFESRSISTSVLPELINNYSIQSLDDYPNLLLNNLLAFTNQPKSMVNIVILTLGVVSYSYLEQCYLAKNMGIPLVEPQDLIVEDDYVFIKTPFGNRKVDVIYRRMDDEYFTPSLHKVSKNQLLCDIYSAYLKGKVVLVNAIGNGVADDKAVYAYVPDMIKYYLNEEPILKNIKTYRMDKVEERNFVYKNISEFVIKKTDSMRGIGMLMGNIPVEEEIEKYKLNISNNPRNFIAQPIINFSKLLCLIDGKLTSRRIDLRPYALMGVDGIKVINAILTRVAMKDGSYDVSSPQGSRKDTWILNE